MGIKSVSAAGWCFSSLPSGPRIDPFIGLPCVAQLVARVLWEHEGAGSRPATRTIFRSIGREAQGNGLLSRGRASGPLVRIQHAPPVLHSLGSSIGQDNWFSPSKGGFDSPIEHQTLHGSAGRAPSSYGGVRRFESCCSVHFSEVWQSGRSRQTVNLVPTRARWFKSIRLHHFLGHSPSGKAPDFDSGMRWFDSSMARPFFPDSSDGRAPHC